MVEQDNLRGRDYTERPRGINKRWLIRYKRNTFNSDEEIEATRLMWEEMVGFETTSVVEDEQVKFIFNMEKTI